jgi:hypothetical protein
MLSIPLASERGAVRLVEKTAEDERANDGAPAEETVERDDDREKKGMETEDEEDDGACAGGVDVAGAGFREAGINDDVKLEAAVVEELRSPEDEDNDRDALKGLEELALGSCSSRRGRLAIAGSAGSGLAMVGASSTIPCLAERDVIRLSRGT